MNSLIKKKLYMHFFLWQICKPLVEISLAKKNGSLAQQTQNLNRKNNLPCGTVEFSINHHHALF